MPKCYLVSNEIVFGKQTHNTIPFPSHDCGIYPYNELFNKANSEKLRMFAFFLNLINDNGFLYMLYI